MPQRRRARRSALRGVVTSTDALQFFNIPWDTDYPWAEGVYELRAVAVDDDGNSNPDEALIVKIRIDRTSPVVYYSGAGFSGFIQSLESYADDGVVDHSSTVIKRDPDTGDVEFRVYTTDTDVQYMTLQWRYASDPLGMWRGWDEMFNEENNAGRRIFQDFEYEPTQNFGDARRTASGLPTRTTSSTRPRRAPRTSW